MSVPFLDLKRQYKGIQAEVEPVLLKVAASCGYIGGGTVKQFEDEIADYLGVRHAIGCGNGTDALVLALRALGIGPRDEVITTPFTFFATAEAIASVGATPVFVDIREDDLCIDPGKIEEKITDKTKAILPVHIFGAPCDMAPILDIAARHDLRVVEDAAQAIGCRFRGKMAGSIGDIGCFSFYPTKNLGAFGDGGMVTTDSDELAVILRAFKEHGAGPNGALAQAYLRGESGEAAFVDTSSALYNPQKYYNYLIGGNSRLDVIQAAVLSVKLKYLPDYNAARAAIAKQYNALLCDAVRLPQESSYGTVCWHQYVIRTEHKAALCQYLEEHGVEAGTFYPVPLHLQKAFVGLGDRPGDLPVAEKAAAETVCLPIFPELTGEEVALVAETVNRFFEGRH